MDNRYSLVLTGEVLPGFAPGAVWPQLAAWIGMAPDRLTALVARAPLVIKQDSHLGQLNAWQAGITQAGAQSEICPPDDRLALFVQIEGTARGPIPRLMVEQRVRQGLWPDSIRVAQAGSSEWQPYSALDAAVPAPAAPSIQVADLPPALSPQAQPASGKAPGSVWAAPASMQNLSAIPELEPASELPPGEAIHAGFWRRNAALTLDYLIIFLPLFILNIIPFIGGILGIVGQWLYFALMDSSEQQSTLGKRVMGIKVVDKCGRRLGFGRATWRFFSEVVVQLVVGVIAGMIAVFVFIGDMVSRKGAPSPSSFIISGAIFTVVLIAWCITFMMIGWTERRQSLYDKMAATLIVFREVEPGQPLPTQRPPMPWYGWVLNIAPPILGLAIIGIIAAIAVPAYQDYTLRAKVAEAITAANPVKEKIAREGCTPESIPPGNSLIEKLEVGQNPSDSCSITLTFAQSADVPKVLHHGQIQWTSGEDNDWACSVSSARMFRYVPKNCRSLAAEEQP